MNEPMPTEAPIQAPADSAAPTRREPSFQEILDRMTPVERLRAYRSGAFTVHECGVWASRFPEEAPIVNDEYEWIALTAE
jgi:hypothetical protein